MKQEPSWSDLVSRVLNQIANDVYAQDFTAIEELIEQLTIGSHPKRRVLMSYLNEVSSE